MACAGAFPHLFAGGVEKHRPWLLSECGRSHHSSTSDNRLVLGAVLVARFLGENKAEQREKRVRHRCYRLEFLEQWWEMAIELLNFLGG